VRRARRAALFAAAALGLGAADPGDVERAEGALRAAAEKLLLVEKQYAEAIDPSELLQLRKRFADGETQYLLEEYANAAALLYEVVDSPLLRNEELYSEAVHYLADSLYRTGSWLEARRYYRQLFAANADRRLQESLLRLIDLSERLGDFSGIDELHRALLASSQPLRPEVVYVHARWLARRPDLPDGARIPTALTAFSAIPDDAEHGPQARYFEGVLYVQQGALEAATQRFEYLLKLPAIREESPRPAPGRKEKAGALPRHQRLAKLRDLARLALGRIAYEQGKISRAIDHYHLIPKESDSYADALYELSASWLKLGEHGRALRATELLLFVVEESVLAPEARLQQASLHLKLKKYAKAMEGFEEIAARYRPLLHSIAALTRREDPVSYYDDLLRRGEKTLDATQLLPEVARKYVSGRDVGHARLIVDELEGGKAGIEESGAILARLEAAVREGKLDLFPILQESNARAVEVENALARLEGQLAGAFAKLAAGALPAARAELAAARAVRQALESRVAGLPATPAQFEERRRRYAARAGALEKQAFRLGYEIDNLNAQLVAIEKWRADTAAQRKATERDEREFAGRVEQDRQIVARLERERQEAARQLAVASAATASAAAGGEADERLRGEYLRAAEREAVAGEAALAHLGPSEGALSARLAAARKQSAGLRKRVLAVREVVRARAGQRLATLRERIEREAEAVRGYRELAARVEGEARQLVGRIAFQSFQRVAQKLGDLVLKADVGLLDAAWTRKRESSDAITAAENERRAQLKELAAAFAEALREVE